MKTRYIVYTLPEIYDIEADTAEDALAIASRKQEVYRGAVWEYSPELWSTLTKSATPKKENNK